TFGRMEEKMGSVNGFEIKDEVAKGEVRGVERKCEEFGVRVGDVESVDEGIVDVVGGEVGLTVGGKRIVWGESDTSTHGGFGGLGFGMGRSEVEHVLSTQRLWE
ncbi:aconitase family protein, partial [Bacillus subtilis]|uniref:aconitase family protein n=1 Tax=Bacillus subtilis TaxID=1423 RepID=UPI0020788FCB